MTNDIFSGRGIEVRLFKADDFLKIKETLTRIGIASSNKKTLYQSCHILHKQGRYAIMHFKELLALDGKETDLSESDLARRNTIVNLLKEWNLVTVADLERDYGQPAAMSQIKIISHASKHEWTLVSKYTIGRKK